MNFSGQPGEEFHCCNARKWRTFYWGIMIITKWRNILYLIRRVISTHLVTCQTFWRKSLTGEPWKRRAAQANVEWKRAAVRKNFWWTNEVTVSLSERARESERTRRKQNLLNSLARSYWLQVVSEALSYIIIMWGKKQIRVFSWNTKKSQRSSSSES